MPDFDMTAMHEVTRYSPIRILISAIWRLLFGAMLALPFYALIFAMMHSKNAQHSSADPPAGLLIGVGIFFMLFVLAVIGSAVGRIVSAFSRGCYFRAGNNGIAIRMPKRGWFGRFRLVEYNVPWSDVKNLVHFTYRINGIPSSTELRIERYSGKPVVVERIYFSIGPRFLQAHLLDLRAQAAH